MKSIVLHLLVFLALAAMVLGCGGNLHPGINSAKDRPKPAEKGPPG